MVRGKVVGVVANMHHYKGSCLLFRLFGRSLLRGNIGRRRVVRISLRSQHGGRLERPSELLSRVSKRVASGSVCCVLLSRVRLIPRFRSMLGDCLGVGGASMCIAKDGDQVLSDSMGARFHNQKCRVEIRPLDFSRFLGTKRCAGRLSTLRSCVVCKKVPRIMSFSGGARGRGCLGSLFRKACVHSVGRHCGVEGSSSLDRLVSVVTSGVNYLAGPAGLRGAFGSMGNRDVSSAAVRDCLKVLRSTFVLRGTVQCSVGKGRCVGAPSGCCFRSIKLHGTHLGCHRVSKNRLVRGVVCGRLHVEKCSVSMKRIRIEVAGSSKGGVQGLLRISFVYGDKSGHICVRSTLSVPARRGVSRRAGSLHRVGSKFPGVIVIKNLAPSRIGASNVSVVGVVSFLGSARKGLL